MSAFEASDALHGRVQAFFRASLDGVPIESFEALALDVARFQASHIPALARLGASRGRSLEDVAAIPALPCDVFRLVRVAAHAPDADVRVFRTSGTSLGPSSRGEHPVRSTATYELAALSWGERMLWPDRARFRVLSLAPSTLELPDSSLSFMLSLFAQTVGETSAFFFEGEELLDEAFERACEQARDEGTPALVFGTSFAFVHWLDRRKTRVLALPPGSRVMHTGGTKGRSREVDPAELRRELSERLGVPVTHVVGEYGMTELSSQLYEGSITKGAPHGVYYAPPWVQVTAVDPVSLDPVPRGKEGIARIVDLANVDSSVAIQTADRVRVEDDGGVLLLGRAPGAPPRGCSLAIDEILGKR